MTPQTADFRTKYKTLSATRSLSLTLVLYFIFPAAHVGLSCNCSRKKPRGSFLWWRAPSFSRRKRLESNNFSLLLFWCGHSFPRITSGYLLGLRCALGLKRTPPPDLSLKLPHKKQYCALSLYDQVFQYPTTRFCFTAAKCFSCFGLSLNLFTSWMVQRGGGVHCRYLHYICL